MAELTLLWLFVSRVGWRVPPAAEGILPAARTYSSTSSANFTCSLATVSFTCTVTCEISAFSFFKRVINRRRGLTAIDDLQIPRCGQPVVAFAAIIHLDFSRRRGKAIVVSKKAMLRLRDRFLDALVHTAPDLEKGAHVLFQQPWPMIAINPRQHRTGKECEECPIFAGRVRLPQAGYCAAKLLLKAKLDHLTLATGFMELVQLRHVPQKVAGLHAIQWFVLDGRSFGDPIGQQEEPRSAQGLTLLMDAPGSVKYFVRFLQIDMEACERLSRTPRKSAKCRHPVRELFT